VVEDGLTPAEIDVLITHGFARDGRWARSWAPRPLAPAAIAKLREDHQPAPYYGRGPKSPLCRHCRQSWRCDTTKLLDTIGVPQWEGTTIPEWMVIPTERSNV
jgi:hypothetical protein